MDVFNVVVLSSFAGGKLGDFKLKTQLIHMPVIRKHTLQLKPGRSLPSFPCNLAAAAQLLAAVRFPSSGPKYVQPELRKQSTPFAVVTPREVARRSRKKPQTIIQEASVNRLPRRAIRREGCWRSNRRIRATRKEEEEAQPIISRVSL